MHTCMTHIDFIKQGMNVKYTRHWILRPLMVRKLNVVVLLGYLINYIIYRAPCISTRWFDIPTWSSNIDK